MNRKTANQPENILMYMSEPVNFIVNPNAAEGDLRLEADMLLSSLEAQALVMTFDDFKSINDTYMRDYGFGMQKAIQQVRELLSEADKRRKSTPLADVALT